MQEESNSTPPWYRQFWPWFIIALPATVVVAGFTTLYIALQNPHSMVDDAYYEEGLAINQSLEQDNQASLLGMSAQVFFDPESFTVRVNLDGTDMPESLELRLMHPISDQFDQQLELQSNEAGIYTGQYSETTQTNYYIRVTPPSAVWRLNGEVDFRFGRQVLLSSALSG